MKPILKRLGAFAVSVSLSLAAFAVFPKQLEPSAESEPLFFSECEDAQITNDLTVTNNIYNEEKSGYSGDGFVWMMSSGTITFEVTVPKTDVYAISMRYMQELSEEGRLQYLYVNGVQKASAMLPYTKEWSDYDFGVFRLDEGVNTVEIKSGWGYAYYDTFTVDYADIDSLDVEPELVDEDSTTQTQALMNYLTEVYGDNILSGQQEVYGNGHDGDMEYEFEWLYDLTGKYPAIRGFDYMNYNPLYGWDDQTTERIIEWVNERNGIATVCWHIHVPNDFASYELGTTIDWTEATYKPKETDFDTSQAIVEGTKEYEYLQLAIDDLAAELLRLQDAGVPVIFRPYHEAEGNTVENGGAWFWWGSGGPEVYKVLWEQLYDKLTQEYGIHNLIWTYNSYTYESSPAWYPGDDLVDIVGYDKYNVEYNRTDGLSGVPNEDAISSIFYKLVELTDGQKMVAMTENDTIPNIENLTIERAGWLYFCPWYMEYLMDERYNNPETLIEIYQSEYTITLDELPADLYVYDGGDVTYELGDVNMDGEISVSDIVALKKHILNASSLRKKAAQYADINGDGVINSLDAAALMRSILSK